MLQRGHADQATSDQVYRTLCQGVRWGSRKTLCAEGASRAEQELRVGVMGWGI